VQVAVWEPSETVSPEAGKQVTETDPSTMSLAVGVANVTVAPAGLVASIEMGPGGPVRVGAVVSTTVTMKEFTTIEGSLSSVQVTGVVASSAKWEPGAGSHVVPGSTSKLTFAPVPSVASAIMAPLLSQCIAEADGVRTSASTMRKSNRRKVRTP
jgi:hypothetical protein